MYVYMFPTMCVCTCLNVHKCLLIFVYTKMYMRLYICIHCNECINVFGCVGGSVYTCICQYVYVNECNCACLVCICNYLQVFVWKCMCNCACIFIRYSFGHKCSCIFVLEMWYHSAVGSSFIPHNGGGYFSKHMF